VRDAPFDLSPAVDPEIRTGEQTSCLWRRRRPVISWAGGARCGRTRASSSTHRRTVLPVHRVTTEAASLYRARLAGKTALDSDRLAGRCIALIRRLLVLHVLPGETVQLNIRSLHLGVACLQDLL
jgi:hypothetical protein